MKKDIYLYIMYAVALLLFWVQQYNCLWWDYAAYADNALRILGRISYFEWMRPPLFPIVLAPFLLLGSIGKYLLTAVLLAGFFWLAFMLAKRLKVKKEVFIFFMLQPIFLFDAVLNGTELFSILFFMAFLVFMLDRKPIAGLFLGFGILSRYSLLYFLPILLMLREWKKIAVAAGFSLIPLGIWFIINHILTGHMLTSIADNFALNSIFRSEQFNYPIQWNIVALYFSLHLALAFGGIVYLFRKKKLWMYSNILMLLLVPLIFYPYAEMPLKVVRYLFFLVIPLGYFGSVFYMSIRRKYLRIVLVASVIVVTVAVMFAQFGLFKELCDDPIRFSEMDGWTRGLGEEGEMVMSNGWVHLNYYGLPAVAYPGIDNLEYSLLRGAKVVVFKEQFIADTGFEWGMRNFSSYPLIVETGWYAVMGIPGLVDMPRDPELRYLENVKEMIYIRKNERFDSNPCNVLFKGRALNSLCHIGNLDMPGTVWELEGYDNNFLSGMDCPFYPDGHDCPDQTNLLESFLGCADASCEALLAEELASVGSGMNRSYYLGVAGLRWQELEHPVRSQMIYTLREGLEPIPPVDVSYYAGYSERGTEPSSVSYCEIEDCSMPLLAVRIGNYWYLPGTEGRYRFRVSEEDVLKKGNLFISAHVVRIHDDEIEVVH